MEFLNNCWHFEITVPHEILCLHECIPEHNFLSEYFAFEQWYMWVLLIQFPTIFSPSPHSYKSLSSSHFLRPPIVHTDLHLHLIKNSLAITSFQSSFPSLNILLAHSMQSKPAWRLDRPGNETNLAVYHCLHCCAFTVLTKYSSPWQQVSLWDTWRVW